MDDVHAQILLVFVLGAALGTAITVLVYRGQRNRSAARFAKLMTLLANSGEEGFAQAQEIVSEMHPGARLARNTK